MQVFLLGLVIWVDSAKIIPLCLIKILKGCWRYRKTSKSTFLTQDKSHVLASFRKISDKTSQSTPITPFSRLLRGVSLGFCAEGSLGGDTPWPSPRGWHLGDPTPLAKLCWHGYVGRAASSPVCGHDVANAREPAVHSCSVIRQECFPEGPASRGREGSAARGLGPRRARRERSAVRGVPVTLGAPH